MLRKAMTALTAAWILTAATLCGGTARAADPQPPEIMPRAAWQAKPAVTANMLAHGRPYRGIVIHHTQIAQDGRWKSKSTAQKMRDIQRDHQQRPHKYRPEMKGKIWGDFAYHYFIDTDGQIAEGRDARYQGDSGTRYDLSGLLLVVLQGDFDKDQPTRQQLASLDRIVAWLSARHKVGADMITAHDDHAATKCPGRSLKSYLPELKRKTAVARAPR